MDLYYNVWFNSSPEWIYAKQLVRDIGSNERGIRKGVTFAALQDSLKRADVIVVLYDQSDTAMAFSILQIVEPQSGWLLSLVVASPGWGSRTIQLLQHLVTVLSVPYICLFALAHVINFYRRLGFENTTPLQCSEEKDVHEAASNVQEMKFENSLDAITDEQFHAFLELLVERGLTKQSKCQDIWVCQREGFVMTWCST